MLDLPVLGTRGRVDDGVGAAVAHGGGAHRAGVGEDVDVVASHVLAEAAVAEVDVCGRAALAELIGGLGWKFNMKYLGWPIWRGLAFVDMKFNVPSQDKLLTIKCNLKFVQDQMGLPVF